MAKRISDELRDWCDSADVDGDACGELRDLVDRIDNEMVELPRDMDGLPIHAGDTVYLEDGRKADVSCVHIAQHSTSIDFQTCGDGRIFFSIEPKHFAHERPDSWERIAKDLEDWSDDNRTNWISDVFDRSAEFAHRIRKLAEKEGER